MTMFKKITTLMIVAFLFVGCNDLLDSVEPSTAVSGEAAFSSKDGIDGLRASMYSKIRGSGGFTTLYMVGPGAFADETRSRTGATRYQDLNNATNNVGTIGIGSWGATYNLIQDANLLIGAIPDGLLEDELRDQYRGEAYTIRAMALHHAVRAYGYEPGMAPANGLVPGFDLGVILRTDPVLIVEDAEILIPRSTVDQVYTQIKSDLVNARNLLDGRTPANSPGFANKTFATGLLARVHLYAGNYDEAAALALEAIEGGAPALASTHAAVTNLFSSYSESLFRLIVDANGEPIAGSNVNSGLAAFTSSQWVAQVPTQFVLDLHEDSDFRFRGSVENQDGDVVYAGGGWYQTCFNDQQNTPVNGCGAVNDLEVSTNKWAGTNGNLSDDIPYMRTAELYLIWAEAAAKRDNSVASGIQPLNTLRNARGLADLQAADFANLTEFEDEILDERVREFVVEGHRFWDLKRLGRNIPTADQQDFKFRYENYRMLSRIADGIINTNETVLQNPGY